MTETRAHGPLRRRAVRTRRSAGVMKRQVRTMRVRMLPACLAAFLALALVAPAPGQGAGRQELRSYQPYAGLQEAPVVPLPPEERGVERRRPEIPMPRARSPVITHGTPDAYTAQWYVYCEAKYRSFEPGTGLYTTNSGRKRICH
jgi:hypothetical protein